MIKSFLLNEFFLAKMIKILLIAFLLNTVSIFVFYYEEDMRSLLDSAINFSMTIEQSSSGPQLQYPPQKPQALTPENGSIIPLPFTFTASQFVNESSATHLRSFWIFRRSDGTFDQPVFQVELISPDSLNLTNLLIQPLAIFQWNQTYFWEVRYMNSQDIWSEFSDEKSFMIQEPPPQVIIGSGGGGGTIYYTPPRPPSVPTVQIPVTRPALESGQKKTADENPTVSPLKKTIKTLREKLEEKKLEEQQKKLEKKLKKPSLNIKLNNKKIQKKKSVKIKIQDLTPKKSAKKETKDISIKIRIEKQNNEEKILNREETLRIKEESTKTIPIKESKKLDIGAYVAVVNYEEDGILYSFSESFEIIPSPPSSEFVSRILFWNESSLPFLLLGSTSVLYWKKKQKRKFRK